MIFDIFSLQLLLKPWECTMSLNHKDVWEWSRSRVLERSGKDQNCKSQFQQADYHQCHSLDLSSGIGIMIGPFFILQNYQNLKNKQSNKQKFKTSYSATRFGNTSHQWMCFVLSIYWWSPSSLAKQVKSAFVWKRADLEFDIEWKYLSGRNAALKEPSEIVENGGRRKKVETTTCTL